MLLPGSMYGAHISLHPVRLTDAKEMLEAIEAETTQNLQFFSDPITLERQRNYILRMMQSPSDRLFTITDGQGRIVGTIGLHEIDNRIRLARLGLLIFRAADRGQGFGNEATQLLLRYAFHYYGLNKVIANLFESNTRAQEHYLKIGFSIEGLLREEYLLHGKYHNLVRMTMLAREWSALNRY